MVIERSRNMVVELCRNIIIPNILSSIQIGVSLMSTTFTLELRLMPICPLNMLTNIFIRFKNLSSGNVTGIETVRFIN